MDDPAKPPAPRLRVEALRFLIGGGVNTLLSLGCYWALLYVLPYGAAYTLSFALGILSSYAINTLFVFRTPWSWRRLMAFPLVHLINYGAGLAVVWASVSLWGVDERLAPVLAIAATLPLNFLLSRWLIRGRPVG